MDTSTNDYGTFASRLRVAMNHAGYAGYGSAASLARDMKITPKAVAKWLDGTSKPTSERVQALAKVLKVSAEWLTWGTVTSKGVSKEKLLGFPILDAASTEIAPRKVGEDRTDYAPKDFQARIKHHPAYYRDGNPPEFSTETHPDIIPISVWDEDTSVDDDEVEVPFLREVQLSAGSGRTVIQESSRAKLRFGKRTLRKHSVQFDQAVCVPVHGNSMEPVLPDGSTVAINKGATAVVDGKIYAVAHGGLLRVKTLYRLPNGGIRMRSFNRDEHPDEEYSASQMAEEEIIILGRVFWSAAFH